MKKVFEPGEIELADLRGDPSRAIEIQKKVKELLETNRQRQEGIKQEILEQGAWALPGLINATYVWMNDLEDNIPARDMLVTLMSNLGAKNEAAADLLFRSGIIENPFPIPRKIALETLKEIGWKPDKENKKSIEEEIRSCQRDEDLKRSLDLYAVLLLTGNKAEMDIALKQCEQWTKDSYSDSGKLLALLVHTYPTRIEEILIPIFLAAVEAHESAHKDKSIANTLVDALKPIPDKWLTEGYMIRISSRILDEISPPRHTGIEYMWNDAIRTFHRKKRSEWDNSFQNIGNEVFLAGKDIADDASQSLYRYWFEAVGKVGEVEYIYEQAQAQDELWGTMAAVQLFFAEKDNKQVKQILQKLQNINQPRYQLSHDHYSVIKPGSKTSTEMKQRSGPAGLQKAE